MTEKFSVKSITEKKKEDSGFLEDLDIVTDDKITDNNDEKKSSPSNPSSKFENSSQNQPKKIYKPKWFRELQDPANPQIVKVARSIITNAFTSNKRKNDEKNAKNSKVSEDISQVVQKSSSKFENSRQNQSKIIIFDDQMSVTCDLCQISFHGTQETLKKHNAEVHLSSCIVCGKAVMLPSKENYFRCAYCLLNPTKMEQQHFLKKAKKRGRPRKTHQKYCIICDKLFATIQSCNIHRQSQHNDDNGSKKFKCASCGNFLQTQQSLGRHITSVHEKLKNFSCDFCNTMFARRDHLKSHISALHYEEKLFSCKICQKKFTQRGNLNKHYSTHS